MSSPSTSTSFSGSIPEDYDTFLGPVLFEFSAEDTARRITKALGRPAKVLEIACGTGISTRHLAHNLPDGSEIMATDLNPAMLDHAAKVNADLPGVSYAKADALDLPFDNAEFDAVVCQFGVMFFPDKNQGMKEMNRVLKPAGLVALTVWDSFEQNPAVGIVDNVIKQFFETDPPRFLEIPFGLHDIDDGRQLFLDAGFDSVEMAHVPASIQILDYALPARGFICGNPTIIEIEKRASVNPEDIISASADALHKEFGPAPIHLPFQEIIYLANK